MFSGRLATKHFYDRTLTLARCAHLHLHTYTCTLTLTLAHLHLFALAHLHLHTYTCTLTLMHAYTRLRSHTCTCTCTLTLTFAHSEHACFFSPSELCSSNAKRERAQFVPRQRALCPLLKLRPEPPPPVLPRMRARSVVAGQQGREGKHQLPLLTSAGRKPKTS